MQTFGIKGCVTLVKRDWRNYLRERFWEIVSLISFHFAIVVFLVQDEDSEFHIEKAKNI